jgi:chemotaxis protein MotB
MKKKAPGKDNSERYLLTYADLMNLLLILFIVLYASSKTDVAKAAAVAESIRKGFNASVSTVQTNQSTSSSNTSSNTISTTEDYSGFYDKLIALIKQAGLQNDVQIAADNNDVVITLKDNALYASGSAIMKPPGLSLMTSIGHLLTQVQYELVMVEGYTDTDPIHTGQYQDNLDLSTARANGVNRVLQSGGVPSSKVMSVGHAENDPVVSNDTASHKAENRRVVITILKNKNAISPAAIIEAKDLLSQPGFSRSSASSSAASGSSGSSSSKTSSGKASSSKSSSGKATSANTSSG